MTGDVVAVGDRQEGVEVGSGVLQVHHDHRRGALVDVPFDIGGVEPQRVVDLGEHGHGAGGDHGVHRRDEGEGGDDDLVAGPHAERRESTAQRGGAVGHRDAEGRAEHVARGPLEVGDGAGRVVALVAEERAARDDRRDRVGFLLAEERGALREVERHGRHRRPDLSGQPRVDGGMGKCSDPARP